MDAAEDGERLKLLQLWFSNRGMGRGSPVCRANPASALSDPALMPYS